MLAPAKRARYCRTFSVTPLRPKCRSLGDDRSRAGRARRSLSSCPSVAAGIGSRILTWSHVPRKFTRLSHLSVGVTRNPVFSSFRSGAPVGSIPIARSTAWRWGAFAVLVACSLVAVVAFSRVYLGVHYLSDVLAASAAGVTWLALCLVAVDTLWYRRGRRHNRVVG